MQEKTVISIITVCYNAVDQLSHTLGSVAAQSYPHIQYIVVDGGSTDGTLKLLERYKKHIDILISEKDNGIYDAMNKGIRVAIGDYLCFMNAGDTFHDHSTLQQVMDSIPPYSHPDVIYGETNIVDMDRNFVRTRRLKTPRKLNFNSFIKGMVVCHQSFYARRALVAPYDLQYRFSSDFDWCLRILKRSKNTYNTGLILTDYLSEGATTRHHKESLLERFKIMCHHYGWPITLLGHVYFFVRRFFLR